MRNFSLLATVVALTALAWYFTYAQVQSMGLLMSLGVPMSLGMEGWAGWTSFAAFTGMWLIMMVAMMLPSSYPILQLHRAVYAKRMPDARGGTLLFALGYFLTWTAGGTFFYAAYVAIGSYRQAVFNADVVVLRTAGIALILAGIYQWTRLKQACLKHCQSPLHFIAEHWRDGRLGALRMGAEHGIYCFGCCWGLMTILFVMGVMHLGWMAAIGAIILLEKAVPGRRWIPITIGAIFILVGLVVTIFPDVLTQLSRHVVIATR
jgi:predicted metal-binding membrane protein